MYYGKVLALICISTVQLYGQVNDRITLQFIDADNQPAGLYQMTAEQVKKLATVSRTFADDRASSTTGIIRLKYISKTQFELILSLIDQLENTRQLKALIKGLSIKQLYDLYRVVAFLDIEQLVGFLKKSIELLIATTSPTVLALITLDTQDKWFKDAVTARRELTITPQKDVFTLVFKHNEIIEKPLSEKNSLDKLVKSSETLKDLIEDTGGLSPEKPLYMTAISKKSFELLYDLVGSMHATNAFAEKLAGYSLIQLALSATAADYLNMQPLLDPVCKRLATELLSPTNLKLFKDGRSWGTFLGLKQLTDHAVAFAVSDQLPIRNEAYLMSVLTEHVSGVNSVACSPDGTILASGSDDETIKLWNVVSGKLRTTLAGHTGEVLSVACSSDGTKIASGSQDKTIKLWDVVSGKLLKTLTEHTGIVLSVAYSPDGTTIASGSWDNTIKLWDVVSGKLRTTLTGHTGGVTSVAFSSDGTKIASGSQDKTIKLWDVASGKLHTTLMGHTDWVISVACSPNGTMLASGSWDKTIKLWNMADGKLINTLIGHTNNINSVTYSPDSIILASGSSDDTIKLWDVTTGKLCATLKAHAYSVRSVAFSPDGTMFASGSWDNTIKLWRIITLNDLRDLTLDQVLLIALAHQEHQAGRSLVLTERLEAIFVSLHKPLQKLLIDVFNVRGVTT